MGLCSYEWQHIVGWFLQFNKVHLMQSVFAAIVEVLFMQGWLYSSLQFSWSSLFAFLVVKVDQILPLAWQRSNAADADLVKYYVIMGKMHWNYEDCSMIKFNHKPAGWCWKTKIQPKCVWNSKWHSWLYAMLCCSAFVNWWTRLHSYTQQNSTTSLRCVSERWTTPTTTSAVMWPNYLVGFWLQLRPHRLHKVCAV